MSKLLTLEAGQWYGWQMLPGYGEGYSPYFSPILVNKVQPLKTGQGLLHLDFINVMYAQGVQDFTLKLKILDRQQYYLIAQLGPETVHRNAVISRIDFEWLKESVPQLLQYQPPDRFDGSANSECQEYLNQVFLRIPSPLNE